jgi:hypothetical protein
MEYSAGNPFGATTTPGSFFLFLPCFFLFFLEKKARSARPSARLEGYENYPGGAWFSGQGEGGFKTPDRATPARVAFAEDLPQPLSRTGAHSASKQRSGGIRGVTVATGGGVDDEGGLPSVSILDGVNVSFLNESEDHHSRSMATGMASAAGGGVSSNSMIAGVDPCWVVMFGFPSSQTAQVIEEMLSCGQIVSFHADNPLSNWVHVQFETSLGAQRALTRDGSVLEKLGLMIGVRRSTGRDSKPRIVHSSAASSTQSLFLQQQQRSGNSITSSQLAYAFAPYAINSWWSRFKFYVLGI